VEQIVTLLRQIEVLMEQVNLPGSRRISPKMTPQIMIERLLII